MEFQQSFEHLPPLVATAPHPLCEICVVIPARDEAATVARALSALAKQLSHAHGALLDPRRYEVILLANNCQDATATCARQIAAQFPAFALHIAEIEFPPRHAHIGTARRLLMNEAAHRLLDVLDRPRGIIATTDADTVVTPDWIDATWHEIHSANDDNTASVEAVGGDIRLSRRELAALPAGAFHLQRQDALYHQLAAAYAHRLDPDPCDPWPRHYHHFGGSLAVTARSYRAVGGLPPVSALEDLAFYESLMRHDIPFRHSRRVRVTTSARCTGRTAAGLSATMRHWTEAAIKGEIHHVEAPAALAARLTLRRQLRELWQAAQSLEAAVCDRIKSSQVAATLGLQTHDLTEALSKAPFFGALHEKLTKTKAFAASLAAPISVEAAIAELRMHLRQLPLASRFQFSRAESAAV